MRREVECEMEKIGRMTDKQRKKIEEKRKRAASKSPSKARKKAAQMTEGQIRMMLELLAEETKQKIKNEFKMR